MNDFDIRDLVLAGVKWELTDMPMALASVAKVALTSSEKRPDVTPAPAQNTTVSNSGRTPTSIVPPIAPQQTISIETAVAMAARPADTDSLCRMISEFNHPLRAGATNVVVPHIAENPNGLVIITDVPGGEDDATGQILSGAAGDLLDKMLAAIALSRNEVSIVPLVFWRTPGGRTPTRAELDLAKPFVQRALALLKPSCLLTLGTLSASEIAGVTLPAGHGKVVTLPDGVAVMPLYHPNYLILKPAAKRDAWVALQQLQNLLKSADK